MDNNQTQYNDLRKIFISNLENREYPILPAYYYYIIHNPNNKDLSQRDFQILFIKATQPTVNRISMEVKPPVIDIEEVFDILTNYYNVQELCDKEGNLIKLV